MASKLVLAAQKNEISLEKFKDLIRDKTNTEEDKVKALHISADKGNEEFVEALIDADVDVDAQTKEGVTALMFAADNKHKEVVERLISAGANVDAQTTEKGITALMLAAENGHTEIVERLISAGANVDLKNSTGWSALWLAACNGRTEIVEQLLQGNADVNAQTEEGSTPLIAAAEKGHMGIVKLLLNGKGIDINVKDRNGKTAYDLANNEIKALIINKFPELKGRAYKKEIERGAKIALPVAMVPAIGAIVISVLSETTNLIGNKPFTENKIAIITVSCLAAAAVIIVALGPAIAAIKIKTQIDAVKAESQASPDKAAVHTE
ncbi:MAG: ankyrin repeat domain-containing protein [Rickettsiaceae bacterium H1]|nr:ankyrin repeat domain-containing protein [Rickettsiaceae bacterium H1]